MNAEILCPISPNGSLTGLVFYDGGAAWDTIFVDNYYLPGTKIALQPLMLIQNNALEYRHSIGFGVRLTAPAPLRIDWGFKLDRRPGEAPYEVHILMEQAY